MLNYEECQKFMHSIEETEVRNTHRRRSSNWTFRDLEINQIFFYNNTRYKKISSRTAFNLYYGQKSYFKLNDICKKLDTEN